MRRLLYRITSLPLHILLVARFSLVAAVTIGAGAFATSRVMSDSMTDATSERSSRAMQLAQEFYDIKLREIAGISYRLALVPTFTGSLPQASQGVVQAQCVIERKTHNGRMSVQSRPSTGATFTVTLPTQRTDQPTANGI